ncbi:MAG: nucleotidyltransferase domain-containing protein [Candidatus Magasanikbacteria bacterium]|nr:nucleotidyltransferase domain-containing protein [Candidatus Magasanikbacteria bacterium]
MGSNILAVILFGSFARGDNDPESDYDLCVLTQERQSHELNVEQLNEIITDDRLLENNPVFYPASAVASMLKHGSLFLWHLKQEGKVLYGEEYFSSKIKELSLFIHHHEDIAYHKELFCDLVSSWEYLSLPNELDLSILFTIARNTCMILAHKFGKPSFGRLSSFVAAKSFFSDLPINFEAYQCLSTWKIIYERDMTRKLNLPTAIEFKKIIDIIDKLLRFADAKTF